MLTPRYGTFTESVSDFKRMLDGMNQIQPQEYTVSEEMDFWLREEQEVIAVERVIDHFLNAMDGHWDALSEAQRADASKELGAQKNELGRRAERAKKAISHTRVSGNPALMKKVREVYGRIDRRMKNLDKAMSKSHERAEAVNESRGSSMQRFRILAGMEEQVMMPRDPGLHGTTRFNEGYDQMAGESLEPLMEGGGSRSAKGDRQAKAGNAGWQRRSDTPSKATREFKKQKADHLADKPGPSKSKSYKWRSDKQSDRTAYRADMGGPRKMKSMTTPKLPADRIKESLKRYQEGRSKEQQAAGQKAMADRSGRVPWFPREHDKSKGKSITKAQGDVQANREKMKYGVKSFMGNPLKSKEAAKYGVSSASFRASAKDRTRSSIATLRKQEKPKLPADRIKESLFRYHEARSKEQQAAGQKAMADRSGKYPWKQRTGARYSRGHSPGMKLTKDQGDKQATREKMKMGMKSWGADYLKNKEREKGRRTPADYKTDADYRTRASLDRLKRTPKAKLPESAGSIMDILDMMRDSLAESGSARRRERKDAQQIARMPSKNYRDIASGGTPREKAVVKAMARSNEKGKSGEFFADRARKAKKYGTHPSNLMPYKTK